ncbi:MAG TPA: helix-turn-helix domain-containing protein, partial [Candidatus Sulfotelmatobacter sp.]|nr:helix-turn-helix domain-containing protein [Candidatus Sulfotelmatobacter sp.]
MEYLSSTEVAKLLKVSIDKIKILEKQGILHRAKREGQKDYYFSKEIAQIKPHHELTITELASLSEIEIQNKTVSLISSFRKIFIITGCLLSGYIVLIVIFAILFIIIPVQTARWLGIVKTRVSASLTQATINKQVLGVATNLAQSNNSSSIQAILQPVGIVALGLVKNINPESYTQISKVAILDMNDVLALNSSNAMTPVVPLKVSNTSLEVTNSGLIQNLNSQYLQGKKPGTNVGDIAVLGNNGGIEGLSTAANGVKQTTNFDSTTLNGLINTNPLGSAGIINTNLVNSAVTITTASPLSGGGTVSLGGTLDLNCPTCNSIVDLTSKVSNVLPLANGGTGAISFATNGILYGNGTSAIQALTPGTSGYILQSNGADSSPSWTAVSELSVGNVPFSGITTGTNTSAIMTIGTGGTLQYSGTGILNANQLLGSTWKAPGTIGATTANTGTFTTLLVTSINGLTITNNGTNTLTIAAGKTLTANNSLTFVGTDGTIFTLPSASD